MRRPDTGNLKACMANVTGDSPAYQKVAANGEFHQLLYYVNYLEEELFDAKKEAERLNSFIDQNT